MGNTDFDPLTETKHKRLKLDWTISIGNLITLAGLAFSVLTAWNIMDKRVVVLEEARTYQIRRDDSQDVNTIQRLAELKEAVKDVKETVQEIRREQITRNLARP